jgi:putative CocE/NonD family hydrolase
MTMLRTLVRLSVITSLGVGTALPAAAQEPATFDAKAHYVKREHMVPMRDGVRLYTIIYTPRDTTRVYPIMLFRTPYSIRPYEPDVYRAVLGPSAEFDRAGYVFVFQDVRGKYRSEGEFEVMRPFRRTKAGPADTDDSSDTYDTIEWLLANVRGHNGRVGMWGVSYPGWQTVMGMMDPHPALAAASPMISSAESTSSSVCR